MFDHYISARVLRVAPHSDISQLLDALPAEEPMRDGNVLYVGYRHMWPLIALAHHRPDITFWGFDQESSAVKRVRATAEKLSIGNIHYLETSFTSLRKSRGDLAFDAVIFMPPLIDFRERSEVNVSRMRSIANSHALLRAGGVFVMQAALTNPALYHTMRDDLRPVIVQAYVDYNLNDAFLEQELALLKVDSAYYYLRFLLNHAGRVHQAGGEHRVDGLCGARLARDRTSVCFVRERTVMHLTDHVWKSTCVVALEDCVRHVRGLDLASLSVTHTLPQRLRTHWTSFFGFDTQTLDMFALVGTITGRK